MFEFLLGVYLEMELLAHMVTLSLPFEELSDCSARQLYKFSFPSAVCEAANISTYSSTLVITCLCFYSGDNFESESEHFLITSGMNQV